jgi:hypothetical protein
VLGVERETPGYIMREECQRNRLKEKAGERAGKFEDKLDGRKECRILTKCWREKKKHTEEGEREREILSEKRACQWRSGKIKRKRKINECRDEWKEWKGQTQTSKKEGEESKNPDTTRSIRGVWMTEEIPEYLGRESAKERKMIASFWCENEKTENRYWMEGDEIRRRMCYDMRRDRQLSTCGMDVAKWGGEREREREREREE